jgi:DNA primase
MAGRIPQSFIDELIARADIVELIGNRVPLKKAGHEYKACCPFHDEKTPSFWVSPDKQFYHCFGCGAHGTALGFLIEYDRLSFPEAVEELASRLGLTVPHEAGRSEGGPGGPGDGAGGGAGGTGTSADTERTVALYELLSRAADHFRANLARSERARAYATARGLSAPIIERFGIGYAADSWNDLLRRFGANDSSVRDLAAAGLIIERDSSANREADGAASSGASTSTNTSTGASASTNTSAGTSAGAEGAAARYYDRFRDRLMFPIRDTRGRVIAFGGRVLGSGEPKYLNSPETALFHKGQELYGLYESRLARQSLKRLLVVEGYMDVVRLHQHGLAYSVATLGTATTPDHVRRAFRLVSEVVFAFDGDRAGRAAAWRALQAVLPEARAGREIRFLFLPEGEDPDSLVGQEGGERFEARLSAAMPLSEYFVAHLAQEADVSHADGKAHFIALARPLLERIAPGVYRELLLERVALALGLPLSRLQPWLTGARVPSAAGLEALRAQPAGTQSPAARTSGLTRAGGHRAGSHRPRPMTGRGSLITQAITVLLHFPAAATTVDEPQRARLARVQLPGVGVLVELLEQLATGPTPTLAQTLERWRERHEYRRLCQLAATATLVSDAQAAGRELSEAVRRLLQREHTRRLELLIEKARLTHLDEAEKLELQSLTSDQGSGSGGSAPLPGPREG